MPSLSKGLIRHGIRTAHLWQSRQAEARKRNFTSWGMMAERKNGRGTSAIWRS